jgi:uncharacterized protein
MATRSLRRTKCRFGPITTDAEQQKASLLDHLIGASALVQRHRDTSNEQGSILAHRIKAEAQTMKLTLKHALAAILLMLSFAAPVAAGPFEDATAAYARGDYATALRLLRPLADQGNNDAQFNLGFMYAKGHGVTQDYAEAVKWFRLAAEQGYARADGILGYMYSNGQGVQQDYAEAVKWYRKAAEQGSALGEGPLGIMYMLGQGVPQD